MYCCSSDKRTVDIMSFNKIKSLRLQRNSSRCESANKMEDKSTLSDETRTHTEKMVLTSKNSESLTPLHSTPKKSIGKSNDNREQSKNEHRVSPILLPCTQDSGNEVAWDWQSSLIKSDLRISKNGGESIGTPKRTTLLQKKRNSNSPLLYKPIKRKLMRNEHQRESIEKFTAEMKALSEEIRTVPREEISKDKRDERDDDLSIQIDVADFVECENKFRIAASDDDDSRKNCRVKTNVDDLFDDSVDDSMVKCSQEVEEKLRLESYREKSSKDNSGDVKDTNDSSSSWHQKSYSRFLTAREKTIDRTNDSENSSNTIKIVKSTNEAKQSNPSSLNLTEGVMNVSSNGNISKTSCANNKSTKFEKSAVTSPTISLDNDFFEIPDDSFDDFIAICFDDVDNPLEKIEQDVNQTSSRYGKVYVSPHSTVRNDNPRKFDKCTPRNILLPPPSESSCSIVKASSTASKSGNVNKIIPLSVSNDCYKPSSSFGAESLLQSQTTVATATTTTTKTTIVNEGRKFFKTKSLSTSSFDDQSNTSKNCNGSSNSSLVSRGWKSNIFTNGKVSSSVSKNECKPIKNDNGKSNNAWRERNFKEDNGEIWNVNRKGSKEGDNIKLKRSNDSERASGSQSTQICTPEEIERKRLEAKMKLEAKRKLIGRSTSANSLSGETSKRSMKR